MRAAVIGLGVVGKAQVEMLRPYAEEVVTYDAASGEDYPYEDIARCDFAVVAVGTPPIMQWGPADLSQVEAAIQDLPDTVHVMLRSTVPPGTTESFAAELRQFAHHYETPVRHIVHVPEFLHEREDGPWKHSTDVPWLLLGGGETARACFRRYIDQFWPNKVHECTSSEAEMAKYTANLYWAARVTFVNEMANIARAHDVDWEKVREAWLCDPRVGSAYTKMEGFEPGYGGRCWPKDLDALNGAAQDVGYDAWFLRRIRQANLMFRKDLGTP